MNDDEIVRLVAERLLKDTGIKRVKGSFYLPSGEAVPKRAIFGMIRKTAEIMCVQVDVDKVIERFWWTSKK